MENFPPELIDAILECAYYTNGVVDTKTLSSAALLCRAWAVSAQRLLFRFVPLRGMHNGRGHLSFLQATDTSLARGRTLGEYIRILEVHVGDKIGPDLDDRDLVEIIKHAPRLYELILRVTSVHQLGEVTVDQLRELASHGGRTPIRIRALTLLSCGVQSPILYQLLSAWPSIEFLHIGVEIAAPPPKWQPTFRLYQLTLMRTPRLWILSWLLSSSMKSLRIVSFRDAPGRELDPLLDQLCGQLRSLRLMNYSLRASSVLQRCTNLEEFVLVQLSTLIKLTNPPPTLEHLSCRNLPSEDQLLEAVIEAVGALPRLRVVTCDRRAGEDKRFGDLERLCSSKGVRLHLDETPFWVVSTIVSGPDDTKLIARIAGRSSTGRPLSEMEVRRELRTNELNGR